MHIPFPLQYIVMQKLSITHANAIDIIQFNVDIYI